jgi:hypothetical protein
MYINATKGVDALHRKVGCQVLSGRFLKMRSIKAEQQKPNKTSPEMGPKTSWIKMFVSDICGCACVSRSIIRVVSDPARPMVATTDPQVIMSARRRSRCCEIGDATFEDK